MAIWQSLLIISSGAAIGACTRWCLSELLNPLFSFLAFGTLIANYLGCFLIGILIALLWQYPQVSSEWRLFLITGFLGSLTTFSSFSAEVVNDFLTEKWATAVIVIALHLGGSLFFTLLGVLLWRAGK
ncbi:fluoride efflux transporter CrcB [Avibacterium paragallinarum]|uniref:fluoride efflux transporter CrcB n=1 Tax=Avibacterium paragallinarum TaxID=728 RepID=UPI00021ACF34|nr:fluoride efflux transporter CrcB [Avibacterium paragallinarum]AZI15067.1 fluoride efflux transporter CrcB [Avibacterium paragallinarum]QIR12499.1 fluoride efflux transporter CrcB [Avibacterium paragallinarum]QJE10546.1 fluoride efflux transporter CrcB [Avibacterium paragallinarum]QJE12739.1 fluoride efflux transporter CrcB [Avibacterium paragallinarum]QJE14941.1 fluoride efflux transporter CrcB [Avibacterium paragallinarum]